MERSLLSPSTKVRQELIAHYDEATVHAILDDGFVAHVGITADDGRPVVIPMLYARDGGDLLVHGSPATRLVRALNRGADLCLTVTHLDGILLARSAFHHSLHYRSVVVMGRARPIRDLRQRQAALELLTDHVVPGRLDHLRPMTETEIRKTTVLRLPIDEASAKISDYWPLDEEEDFDLPIWAGVLPITQTVGYPKPCPRNLPDLAVPSHILAMRS